MNVPRVVIDTNCLVSALIFSRRSFAWLRQAWQAQRFVALASRETVSELLRVLAYPKFKLTRDEQQALLAEFLPYVETVQIDTTPDGLPDIRDADDTIFLVLAAPWYAAMVEAHGPWYLTHFCIGENVERVATAPTVSAVADVGAVGREVTICAVAALARGRVNSIVACPVRSSTAAFFTPGMVFR